MKIIDSFVPVTRIRQSTREHLPCEVHSEFLRKRKA